MNPVQVHSLMRSNMQVHPTNRETSKTLRNNLSKHEWNLYRRRVNQRKYRRQKRERNLQLEQDVVKLRQVVHELEDQQLYHFMSSANDYFRKACNADQLSQSIISYFEIFKHGFLFPRQQKTPTEEGHKGIGKGNLNYEGPQERYLKSIMAPYVQLSGGYTGIKKHIEQWETLTRLHGRVQLKLDTFDLKKFDTTTIVPVSATLRVLVTETTIEHVYPGLVNDESLKCQLLNQWIEYDFQVHFYFNMDHKIEKLTFLINTVQGLLSILGNIVDVAKVVNTSRLGEDVWIEEVDSSGSATNDTRSVSPNQTDNQQERQQRQEKDTQSEREIEKVSCPLQMTYILN